MTRLWAVAKQITVAVDEVGRPLHFVWGRQQHTVTGIAKRWRVDVGWWQMGRGHLWREHYKLTTDTGLLVIVYHDLVRDQWFLQRLYD